jgi:hypothetical protein
LQSDIWPRHQEWAKVPFKETAALQRLGGQVYSAEMSKTRLFQSIKSLNLEAVDSLLEAHPDLKQVKDERGRNALHLLCSLPTRKGGNRQSLELAQYLLGLGFDINVPAFVEGAFKATPLWYAISRGRNLPLAKLLLKKGSSPNTVCGPPAFTMMWKRSTCWSSTGQAWIP